MTNLIPFNFNNQDIRVLEENGEAWFVAKDICDALDITWQGKRTLSILPDEWVRVVSFTTEAGKRETITITEALGNPYKLHDRTLIPLEAYNIIMETKLPRANLTLLEGGKA